MSEFNVKVVRLTIEEHPNADALELAVVGGYRSIVRKGQFQTGDLAVYIPEQAVLPQWLVKELGLEGRLAGKNSDRVKAIKLRGVLSQGLIYPLKKCETTDGSEWYDMHFIDPDEGPTDLYVPEGAVVTHYLRIVKYEPPIPVHMAGQVWNASGKTLRFDIENWKNNPDVIQDGEEVIFTEKAHGTFVSMGIYDQTYIVNSKGLGKQGLAFKLNPMNASNLYVKMFNDVGQALVDELTHLLDTDSIFVLGEIFGKGVQDLHYGSTEPVFRVFDIYVGNPNGNGETGRYLNSDEVLDALEWFENRLHESDDGIGDEIKYGGYAVEYMPVLYSGPFSVEVMQEYTDGKETLSGKEAHIREGIVIRTAIERRDNEIGRVILKSVSAAYLTRKGDATEYQ
jgi:RNA ligase (TIGR02306 family)